MLNISVLGRSKGYKNDWARIGIGYLKEIKNIKDRMKAAHVR